MARWHDVLEEVVRERRPALVGYASLFVRDPVGAEDLVQEALVRVFGRVRRLTDRQTAEAYVRHAIRTAFLDQTRRAKVRDGHAHLFVDGSTVRGPEASVAAGLDVGAALEALSPRERACVVLRHFDDLPVAEVAVELGLSTGSVKRYLSDATAKLRSSLGEDVVGETPADAGPGVAVIQGRNRS